MKSWLIGKDSDAGTDWGQEEKGTTEDEMAGWYHWLDGSESEWTPGVGDGQGGLACCDSWGRKESDMTERLNWTEHWGICEKSKWLCNAASGAKSQVVNCFNWEMVANILNNLWVVEQPVNNNNQLTDTSPPGGTPLECWSSYEVSLLCQISSLVAGCCGQARNTEGWRKGIQGNGYFINQ